MPVGVEPLPPLEVVLEELLVVVDGRLTEVDADGRLVDADGRLTEVDADGRLTEVELPLDWLEDTVYTADGLGLLLELEVDADGRLVDDGRAVDGELIPLDGLP